jgi:hypothetical protein
MPTTRRCFLHVGAPKTGSTAIQNSLFFSLRDRRFQYVSGGQPNGWFVTEALFEQAPANASFFRQQHLYGGDFAKHRRLLARQWQRGLRRARARNADLIISAENLWNASDHCLQELHGTLRQHGYAVEVWAYVRPWRDWQNSLWGQKLLGYGEFPRSPGHGQPAPLSIRPQVERLWQRFGREKVRIIRFDPSSFPQGCVVRHFAAAIGLTVPAGFALQANERLSRPAAQLAYCYHHWAQPIGGGPGQRPPGMHRLRQQLVRLEGPKLRFHDALMEPLMEHWAREDDWLEAELGFRLESGGIGTGGAEAIRTADDLLALQDDTLAWLARQSRRPWRPPQAAAGDQAAVAQQLRVLAQRPTNPRLLAQQAGLLLSRHWVRWREAC